MVPEGVLEDVNPVTVEVSPVVVAVAVAAAADVAPEVAEEELGVASSLQDVAADLTLSP